MDAATKIYQDIIAAGEQGLQQMVDERYPEHQHLDFKEAAKQKPPLESDDKRNLSKCLGGFSNTDGGVIIWGVQCRKVNDIDAASALKPISQIEQFRSELDNVTPTLLEPYPSGIVHTVIKSATPDAGYVVSLAPTWDGYPVRSVMKDKGADYFMRSGGGFERMPYSFLADRFGRRPQPKLKVTASVIHKAGSEVIRYLFAVSNVGRGIAIRVAVVMTPPVFPVDSRWWESFEASDLAENKERGPRLFESGMERCVYPGMNRRFYECSRRMEPDEFEKFSREMPIKYEVYCDGYVHQGKLTVTSDVIDTTGRCLILDDVAVPG